MSFVVFGVVMKMDETLEGYKSALNGRSLEKGTIDKYVKIVKNMLSKIGDIDEQSLQKYKSFMMKSLSPVTYNNRAVIINNFLKHLKKDIKLSLIKIQRSTSLDNLPTATDIKKLKNKLKSVGDIQLEAIFHTFLLSGVRISELSYFTTECLASEQVSIVSKNKKRVVILPKVLVKHLKSYVKEADIKRGKLFQSHPTDHKNYDWVRIRLKKYAKEAKIRADRIYPHNLRHTFSKRFMQSNGKIWVLKDVLGHSNLNTTSIYLQSSLEEQREMVNEIFK